MDHGVYTLLLDAYYALDGKIPLHLSELNRICHATNKAERESVMKVAQAYFPANGNGTRHNNRADRELEKGLAAIEKMRAGGRGGGIAKWQAGEQENIGKGLRGERLAKARSIARHTNYQWMALLEFHNSQCLKCGTNENIVKDHIVPIYKGGSDGIDNIQPLCRSCNAGKGPDTTDLRLNGWRDKCLG